MINAPDPDRVFTLKQAELAVYDLRAAELVRLLQLLHDMAQELGEESHRGNEALLTANKMLNLLESAADVAHYPAALALGRAFFAAGNAQSQHELYCVGMCHIDTAWLWPYAETRRKCARSFATAMRLMDEYPDYKFAVSQAQQLEWVKNQYPSLYAQLKTKAASGQFVPVGGTWVEPDMNIPSGESIVRQFLLGQRFFEREFGRRCSVFWLPDTFGCS